MADNRNVSGECRTVWSRIAPGTIRVGNSCRLCTAENWAYDSSLQHSDPEKPDKVEPDTKGGDRQ
jgi:hypothetical protein